MKKIILPALLLTAMTTFSACGTTGNSNVLGSLLTGATGNSSASATTGTGSTGTDAVGGIVGKLLGNLLGSSSALTQDGLIGTWQYTSPECVFESENFLAKAGGEVASAKIESELASALSKVGIKQGACSFTFNNDNTYSAVIAGKTITGNYTLNTTDNTITMTYLKGLGTMTPKITKSGNSVSLLFESDKLLKLISTVSSLSGSTSAKTLSSLLSNYDGLYIGMQLQK